MIFVTQKRIWKQPALDSLLEQMEVETVNLFDDENGKFHVAKIFLEYFE